MENWMNLPANELKALRVAERLGIVEYQVEESVMSWKEKRFDGKEWHTDIKTYDLFTDEN